MSGFARHVAWVIRYDPLSGERPIPLFEIAPGQFSKKPEFRPGQPHKTDPGLYCMPLWQDHERGIEMRLVLDDRDIEQYRGIEGVEVVEGKDAINTKARELFKPRYSVVEPGLFRISVERMLVDGRVTEEELRVLSPEDQLKLLYEKGALGMRKDEPYQIL